LKFCPASNAPASIELPPKHDPIYYIGINQKRRRAMSRKRYSAEEIITGSPPFLKQKQQRWIVALGLRSKRLNDGLTLIPRKGTMKRILQMFLFVEADL
jgi:hypothetical protein